MYFPAFRAPLGAGPRLQNAGAPSLRQPHATSIWSRTSLRMAACLTTAVSRSRRCLAGYRLRRCLAACGRKPGRSGPGVVAMPGCARPWNAYPVTRSRQRLVALGRMPCRSGVNIAAMLRPKASNQYPSNQYLRKSRRLDGSRSWRLGRLLSGRIPSRRLSGSGGLDSADLAALAALDDCDSHSLALGEISQAGTLEHRAVNEEVLGLSLDRDEAESLHGVVPLHRA
jgi:hypothetical protein